MEVGNNMYRVVWHLIIIFGETSCLLIINISVWELHKNMETPLSLSCDFLLINGIIFCDVDKHLIYQHYFPKDKVVNTKNTALMYLLQNSMTCNLKQEGRICKSSLTLLVESDRDKCCHLLTLNTLYRKLLGS